MDSGDTHMNFFITHLVFSNVTMDGDDICCDNGGDIMVTVMTLYWQWLYS